MDNQPTNERYSRQIALKQFGEEGQQNLLRASVLVIGAGGLGCPALQYLAAAGVGKIGIADDDVVSLSNLQRQVLYRTEDIGKEKALTAAHHLNKLNPTIDFRIYTRIDNNNALEVFREYDIIIDATDNFASRYLINDACVLLNKPLIYGAVSKFEGQIAVFNFNGSTNYRDIFPEPSGGIDNCEVAGVMGVLPGIIGTMQANEAIKIISKIGTPLFNKLLTYNALSNQFYEVNVSLSEAGKKLLPKAEKEFSERNYERECNSGFDSVIEIDINEFNKYLSKENILLIDVRERNELPTVPEFNHSKIPLSELNISDLAANKKDVVFFCQTGKRSAAAALQLKNQTSQKVYSLKGGILLWKKMQEQKA